MESRKRKSAEKESQAAFEKCNVSRICAKLHTGRTAGADFHFAAVSCASWVMFKLLCVWGNCEIEAIAYTSIYFNQIVAAAGVGPIANSIPEANCGD